MKPRLPRIARNFGIPRDSILRCSFAVTRSLGNKHGEPRTRAAQRASCASTALTGCLFGQVLVIDHRIPTPDRDCGSLRMMEIIRAIKHSGHHVTFIPDNMAVFVRISKTRAWASRSSILPTMAPSKTS